MKVRRGINATDEDLRGELIYELTEGYWWHYEDSAVDFDPLLITYEVKGCWEHDHRHEDWIPVIY